MFSQLLKNNEEISIHTHCKILQDTFLNEQKGTGWCERTARLVSKWGGVNILPFIEIQRTHTHNRGLTCRS